MYKIIFTAPPSHVEAVKQAIFKAGAGKFAGYECCAWQVLGQGQFMPTEESDAYIGEANKLEYVDEYKVETICVDECIKEAIKALKEAHPYEVPAYQVIKMVDI